MVAGEENYRQLFGRCKTPKDAALGFEILQQGRAARAVLQQHVPFTFNTSQMFITVRVCCARMMCLLVPTQAAWLYSCAQTMC